MSREKELLLKSHQSSDEHAKAYKKGMADALTCLKHLLGVISGQSYTESLAQCLETGVEKSEKAFEKKFGFNPLNIKIKRLVMQGCLVNDVKKEKFVMGLFGNGFNVKKAAQEAGYSDSIALREGKRLILDEGVQVLIGEYLARGQKESLADMQEMLEKATEIMRNGGEASDQLNAIKVLANLYGVGSNNKSVSVNVGMGVVNQQDTSKPKLTIIKLE